MQLQTELAKYRIMWALRKMEDIIDKEDGMIIIRSGRKIETRGFTRETTERIMEIAQATT
jgi:hypothetical protein